MSAISACSASALVDFEQVITILRPCLKVAYKKLVVSGTPQEAQVTFWTELNLWPDHPAQDHHQVAAHTITNFNRRVECPSLCAGGMVRPGYSGDCTHDAVMYRSKELAASATRPAPDHREGKQVVERVGNLVPFHRAAGLARPVLRAHDRHRRQLLQPGQLQDFVFHLRNVIVGETRQILLWLASSGWGVEPGQNLAGVFLGVEIGG